MLNDYYQNIGVTGFIKRYGIFNAVKRGIFMFIPIHCIKDYELKKVLWQTKAAEHVRKYLKYETIEPQGIEYARNFSEDPIWIYWDTGMDQAPDIVKKCYESVLKYGKRKVIVLNKTNMRAYVKLPDYIESKMRKGLIPMAGYTDLLRFALLEHYGGTWIDSTVLLTAPIPELILNCDFFVFQNTLGLLENPVLYPAWFIHSKKNNDTMKRIRNVAFAYWTKERHVIEYLLPNLIITHIINNGSEIKKKMPYMNSDYSEYLIRVLGDEYSEDKFEWIKGLTGIHKLTYKLDKAINKEGSMYRHIMERLPE